METLRVKDDGGHVCELLKASKLSTMEEFMNRKKLIFLEAKLFDEREALIEVSKRSAVSVHLYEKRPLKEWYGRIFINMKSVNLELI